MPNMERRDTQSITSNYIYENKANLSPLVSVANDMAPGVRQVIEHYELVLEIEHELIFNGKSYGSWIDGDVGTLMRLIIDGVLKRATRLLEAYRVIGVITEEVGQDFPNRVTLLLGKSEAEPEYLLKEKARQM